MSWLIAVLLMAAGFAIGRLSIAPEASGLVSSTTLGQLDRSQISSLEVIDEKGSNVWDTLAKLERGDLFANFDSFRGVDLRIAVSYWLNVDAEATAEWALARKNADYVRPVFSAWAMEHPAAAIEFARTCAIETGKDPRTFILQSLGTHHPEQFFDACLLFDNTDLRRIGSVENAFAWLWKNQPDQALVRFDALAPKQRLHFLHPFLKEWAAIDAGAAFAWIEQNPGHGNGSSEATDSAFLGLAKSDPVAALKRKATMNHWHSGLEHALNDGLIELRTAQIEAVAREHPELTRDLARHLALRFGRKAEEDPSSALAMIDSIRSKELHEATADRFLNDFPQKQTLLEDTIPVMVWASRQQSAKAKEFGEMMTLQLANANGGQLPNDLIAQLAPGPVQEAFEAALDAKRALDSGDYASFQSWHDSRSNVPTSGHRDAFVNNILEQAKAQSREAGLELAGKLNGVAQSRLLGEWFEVDPNAALAWAADQVPEGNHTSPAERLGNLWAKYEPRLAAEWSLTLPDHAKLETVDVVAEGWARSDPVSATEWALSLSEQETKAAALRGTARTWYEEDPHSSTAWLGSLDRGLARDHAISGAMSKTFRPGETRKTDLHWVASIEDDAVRLDTLRAMTRQIYPGALDEVRQPLIEGGISEQDLGTIYAERRLVEQTGPSSNLNDPFAN